MDMYCIITKIQIIEGVLTHTPFGYTVDTAIIESINADYGTTIGQWIEDNKTQLISGDKIISEYFIGITHKYSAKTTATWNQGLIEITNLNQL
jgi:hypothetical protein